MSIMSLMRHIQDPTKSARLSKLGWIVFAVNVIVGIPLIILIIAYLRQR